jgi:4-hydroxyphenylpyruvate dioxygenase-like putative hemolysin
MPVTDDLRKKWHDKFNAIEKANEHGLIALNDWEQNFYDSIYARFFGEGKDLSFKQSSILTKIYNRIE